MNDEQSQRRMRAARITLHEGVLTATVSSGHIEANRGESIRADVMSQVEQAGEGLRAIVLDLGAVVFINSSGLGALTQLATEAPAGVKLFALGLTPMTRESFRLTRVDKLYTIVDGPLELKRALSES